jgi:ethanolamine utilization protein EutP (predicted NTPase)
MIVSIINLDEEDLAAMESLLMKIGKQKTIELTSKERQGITIILRNLVNSSKHITKGSTK